MTNKIFILLSCFLSGAFVSSAQSNLLNAVVPTEIGVKTEKQIEADNDKPLPYGYVDDRDVLWSKVTWEYLDLNERINLPLYYPIDTLRAPANRRSLFDTLLRGIKQGKITEVYDDSYFVEKLAPEDVEGRLHRTDTTDYGFDLINEGASQDEIQEGIDTYDLTSTEIKGFKFKGLWYFDKRQGELKYRLLGIAPVAPDVKTLGRDEIADVTEQLPVFWVWYPATRELMHEMKIFNHKNSAYPISFDHLFNARRFNSIVYKEENIYGDREVKDYVRGNALFQVIESEKLKNGIRNKEHDMWCY